MPGRIRIGNQTAYSAAYPFEPFEYAVASGFDAFEWFPDKKASGAGWAVDEITAAERASLRKAAEAHDIMLTVHASLAADPAAGAGGMFLREVGFARDIGAALINIHLHAPDGVAAFAASLLPVWEAVSVAGMSLSIENTVETGPEQFNELFRFLGKRLPNAAGLGICLDIGHANLCSSTRNDYLGFIDRLDREAPILHVHLHENYGDSDTHLPLFTGPAGKDQAGIVGLARRLRQRGFAGCMILEQWPAPPGLLQEARQRLLDIIGTQPATPVTELDVFSRRLVEADRRSPSWRNKLGWVHDLLMDEAAVLTTGQLAYLAIYLRFVGTGELCCSEDGGHHRPSHHARMSQRIFKRLLRITTPDNDLTIRKIYPWLPSFDEPFQRAEPLTRIRDIAHRGDIPQDLKHEIKTTLQNKLHRSAGPEDLATSAAILRKITAPGAGYSPPFVEEFARFHRELEEFFNARSLDDGLADLVSAGLLDTSSVERFMGAKGRDGGREAVLQTLVELREEISRSLQRADGPSAQRLRMADIGLEDFSFPLLSGIANALRPETPDWDGILRTLVLSVSNLRLSGLPSDECRAIESELRAWAAGFRSSDRIHLLRLRATVERCRRLADTYCKKVLELFSGRAALLGHALGVPEHSLRVYAESDIRAHPVFQVSRLMDVIDREVRARAGLPPWDVIVAGRAAGRLYAVKSMDHLPPTGSEAFVLMVDELTGEEDIPPRLAAIITPRAVPHLSHLAVRARQRHVVFAACEDMAAYESLRTLQGSVVLVDARPGEMQIGAGGEVAPGAGAPIRAAGGPPSVVLAGTLLAMDEVSAGNSGPKAFSLRRLGELARLSDFEVPSAIVLPFGMMEHAIELAGKMRRYDELITIMDTAEHSSLDAALAEMADIVGGLKLPAEVARALHRTFRRNVRLIVRSSASTEDQEGSSEAGLYRSVANLTAGSAEAGVREVWSSLWSRRAVIGRRRAGISGHGARMAVIVQEMFMPDYSFIIHTVNPLTRSDAEVYMELAVGLGEVLASGAVAGTPYRAVCDPVAGDVNILSFASFSRGLWPGDDTGIAETSVIDYAAETFSAEPEALARTALRIARIARAVEARFGGPQDIEGCIGNGTVVLVQSRPQAGA